MEKRFIVSIPFHRFGLKHNVDLKCEFNDDTQDWDIVLRGNPNGDIDGKQLCNYFFEASKDFIGEKTYRVAWETFDITVMRNIETGKLEDETVDTLRALFNNDTTAVSAK